MCRICGRMVKCIFETMPSRIRITPRRTFSTAARIKSVDGPSKHLRRFASIPQRNEPDMRRVAMKTSTQNLPFRAKLHQGSASQQVTTPSAPNTETLPPSLIGSSHNLSPAAPTTNLLSQRPVHSKPLVLSKSLQTLLPMLCSQRPHYITAHIHRFPYLLQAGDTLRLPFHMKGVSPGDVLRFNRASVLGSRDFTLKAGTASTETYDSKRTGEPNYLDERLFEARARVLGVDSGPMFVQEKTKRRNRRVKTVKSKHRYTILKIMEIRIKDLNELMKEKGTVLLES